MVVDVSKTVQYLLNIVQCAFLDVVDKTRLLALRHQQTTQVHPPALTHGTGRTTEEALLLGTLQDCTHIDAQGNVIILKTFSE